MRNQFLPLRPLILLIFGLLVFSGCSTDPDVDFKPDAEQINKEEAAEEEDSEQPSFNEDGLQNGIPGVVNDTIIIGSTESLEIIGDKVPVDNDFSTPYQLRINTESTEKLKAGTVVIDHNDGGRIWYLTGADNSGGKSKSTKKGIFFNAIPAPIYVLLANQKVNFSTPSNRAKTNSTYANKLVSDKLVIRYGDKTPLLSRRVGSLSLKDQKIIDGVTLGIKDNTIKMSLRDVQLYKNNSVSLRIESGSLELNNALDYETKFIPYHESFNILKNPFDNVGNLEYLNAAVYSTLDSHIALDFTVTTNGEAAVIAPFEKTLASYKQVYASISPPVYFTVEVSLVAKLNASVDASLSFKPSLTTKNDFEGHFEYTGTGLPNIQNVPQNHFLSLGLV